MSGLVKATANTFNGCMEGRSAREENWQTLAHFVHFRVLHDKITGFFLTLYQCLRLKQVMTCCRFFVFSAKDNQMEGLHFFQ